MRKVRMKRSQVLLVLSWSLLLWVLLLNNVPSVKSTPQTAVKVEPSANFALVGGTFNVNVTVSDVQNLYGIEATVYWNASILDLVKVDVRLGESDGVLYKPLFPVQNETSQQQGKYILAETSLLPAPSFNGTGNIVRLTFNVTRVGSCELSLSVKLASNIMKPTGVAPIPHTTINGFFGPIQIAAYPEIITVGQSVNVSGLIAPAQADVSVQISYRSDEETEWHSLTNLTTDVHGAYLYSWKPEKGGEYHVRSSAVLLGAQETSPEVLVNISEPVQPVWLYIGTLVVVITVVLVVLLVYQKRRGRRRRPH